MKIYVAEMGEHYDKLMQSARRYDVRSIIHSALVQLIENGIKKELFRQVDSQIAAKAIIALLETLIFESDGIVKNEEATTTFQKVETLFLDGLSASEQNQK